MATIAASSTTGPEGVYLVTLSAGTYDVRVTPPPASGFEVATAPNRTIPSDTTLDFVLVPTGSVTLSGRVLDGLGMPLANQYVTLTPAGGTGLPDVITDDGGNYSFTVSGGDYDLQAYGYPRGSAAPQDRVIGTIERLALTESRVFDIRLPLKRVDVHVQNLADSRAANVSVLTSGMVQPDRDWLARRLADFTTSGTCW